MKLPGTSLVGPTINALNGIRRPWILPFVSYDSAQGPPLAADRERFQVETPGRKKRTISSGRSFRGSETNGMQSHLL